MMDSMLDEYMQDVLADGDMYKEESFDAFESDADSMLMLGQPIDDQIRTMNISSFAIPKKKKDKHNAEVSHDEGEEVEYEDFESEEGEEVEEDVYEDSFESPGKSPNKQDLKELSSITFGQSRMESSLVQEQVPTLSPQKEKKKRTKKKKRVAPATSVVLSGGNASKQEPSVRSAVPPHPTNSTTYPVANSQPGNKKESPRGQHAHEHNGNTGRASTKPLIPRVNTGGTAATGTGRRSQPSAPSTSVPTHYQIPQQYQYEHNAEHARPAHTPPVHFALHGVNGPGSVVSHAPSQSVAGRHAAHTSGAFSAAILQKQLDTALKQVAMYRRENEVLQQNLDGAGINEAVERYKALLISKEHTIHQLESENNGLKSIARYQGKFLNEQAHQPTGIDSVQQHDKQIEIMLIHTRKMKEKVKKMEEREKELLAENEHLRTQNGRIQRKNAKLKKLLKSEGTSYPENTGESVETLQQHQQHVLDTLAHPARDLNASPEQSDRATNQSQVRVGESGSIFSVGVADPHGSHTSQESLGGADRTHFRTVPPVGLLPSPTSNNNNNNGKTASKKVHEELQAQLHKQAGTIESLEKSLQNQRGRFQREIEMYKAQADEAIAEQKKLEVELDKRERFGRNQVCVPLQVFMKLAI